jgi:hypothetical protein
MPASRQAHRGQAPKPRSGAPEAPGLMAVRLPRDNERANHDGCFVPHDRSTTTCVGPQVETLPFKSVLAGFDRLPVGRQPLTIRS